MCVGGHLGLRGRKQQKTGEKDHDEEFRDMYFSTDRQAYQKDIHINKGVGKHAMYVKNQRNACKGMGKDEGKICQEGLDIMGKIILT